MTKIVYISKNDEIPEEYATKGEFKFDSRGRVAEKDGRNYKLIGKKVVELSGVQRLARILAGLTAVIFSLGLAYISKDVRKFLFKASISQRLAQETTEAPMAKKEFFIQRARKKICKAISESCYKTKESCDKTAKGNEFTAGKDVRLDRVHFQIGLKGEEKTKRSIQFSRSEMEQKIELFFDELRNYSVKALRNKTISYSLVSELVNNEDESDRIRHHSEVKYHIGSGGCERLFRVRKTSQEDAKE